VEAIHVGHGLRIGSALARGDGDYWRGFDAKRDFTEMLKSDYFP
jgi:hypothetical protein